MPRQISEQELDAIVAIVAEHPAGVSARLIRSRLPRAMAPRMLQRRLALLIEQDRLIPEGASKSRRYRLPVKSTASGHGIASSAALSAQTIEASIPLSSESDVIKALLRAPLHQRHPVGYQRGLLDNYLPNDTFYLPAATRQRLLEAGRPPGGERPAGTYARTIYNRLLIDLSWNSSRLEGNTYSLLETERLLELGEATEGKTALEAQMILNHKAAIELLVDQADDISFNRYTILNLHALLADNLLADPLAGGRLRHIPVGIAGTVYHPLEAPQRIEECFDRILAKASAIANPYEQSFFVLVHLAYLQGFEDVNKRVSRLAANIPLIRNNLCPLSFVDVPERAYIDGMVAVYELNRVELLRDLFVWACERSSARYSAVRQTLGEPDPFRLRYRGQIAELVSTVVRNGNDKQAATALARQQAAAQIAPADQARFVEVVETELMSLHEGNIARYRLRLAEYRAWRQRWR